MTTGRTYVEAETPIFWPPDGKNWFIWKYPDAGKDLKAGGEEDEMVGWHYRLNGHAAVAAKSLQSCLTLCNSKDSSPPGSPRPWDSPGKNTGVSCHFPLQCMKVKNESEIAQSCTTLCNPMDCSLPGSSVYGISRQEYWSGLPFPSPQWTWVWVNSRSWRWTGRPGVLQSMGSQRVRHDWATKLNWKNCGFD